eukprot:12400882-Karenia_brevis.AAC.1
MARAMDAVDSIDHGLTADGEGSVLHDNIDEKVGNLLHRMSQAAIGTSILGAIDSCCKEIAMIRKEMPPW